MSSFFHIAACSTKTRNNLPIAVQLPDDSGVGYIESVSALQGAVTTTSFKVKAKMASAGQARLVVYSDQARTIPIGYSSLESTLPTNELHFEVTDLDSNSTYYWSINSNNTQSSIKGRCRTFPTGNSTHKMVVSSCARGYNYGPNGVDSEVSNSPVFEHIRTQYSDALYFLHLGDFHYGDVSTASTSDFTAMYDQLLSMSNQQNLYLEMPLSVMWDDHDYGGSGIGSAVTKPHAKEAYDLRVPRYADIPNAPAGLLAHTFVVGRVRYIMLDTRSQSDRTTTKLGSVQKQWFKDTLRDSNEIVNVVNVGFPWNTTSGSDNWVEALDERQELIDYIRSIHKDNNTLLIAGDLHGTAFDNGYNSENIPLLHCGSLDSVIYGVEETAGTKGVKATSGIVMGSDKFTTLEFVDDGTNITLTAKGIDAKDGIETVLATHTQTFSGDKVIITTPNNSATDNNFSINFEDNNANIVADRYLVTVDNIPQVYITETGAGSYQANLTAHTDGNHTVRVFSVKSDKIVGYSGSIDIICTGTGVTYDSNYQAVLDYATANSIALPDDNQKIADNIKMLAYKSIGAFDLDDAIFQLSGTATTAFKLICWKRLIQAIPNGGLTWNTTGVKGNGTDAWIDTLFNPNTGTNNYTLNSASVLYNSTVSDNTDAGVVIGAYNGGYTSLAANRDSGSKNFLINGGYTTSGGDNSTVGLNMLSRFSATEITRGIATKPLTVSANVTSIPNVSFGLLCLNRDTGAQSFSKEEINFAAIGADKTSKYNLLRKILE
jgi:hypothetical protein